MLLAAAFLSAPAWSARNHRAATSGHPKTAHKASGTQTRKLHGQQSIQPERVQAIQTALIREHYLTGTATGQWDTSTQSAMQKFQADQGWQTKLMPDSRALIKLGLGPDHSGAINAGSAANFNTLSPTNTTIPATQEQGFAVASGVSH